jgi:hypothetical protein
MKVVVSVLFGTVFPGSPAVRSLAEGGVAGAESPLLPVDPLFELAAKA